MRILRKYLGLLMSFVLSLSLLAGCADEHAVLVGVSDEAHIQIIGYMVRELAARKGIECQMRETGSGIANV